MTFHKAAGGGEARKKQLSKLLELILLSETQTGVSGENFKAVAFLMTLYLTSGRDPSNFGLPNGL